MKRRENSMDPKLEVARRRVVGALKELDWIRTQRVAVGGFPEYATAISRARVMLMRALEELDKPGKLAQIAEKRPNRWEKHADRLNRCLKTATANLGSWLNEEWAIGRLKKIADDMERLSDEMFEAGFNDE